MGIRNHKGKKKKNLLFASAVFGLLRPRKCHKIDPFDCLVIRHPSTTTPGIYRIATKKRENAILDSFFAQIDPQSAYRPQNGLKNIFFRICLD